MPYYRIVIVLKASKKVIQGIRFLETTNIDAALSQMKQKAYDIYRENNVEDVEVQMLSKNCASVKKYIRSAERRKVS